MAQNLERTITRWNLNDSNRSCLNWPSCESCMLLLTTAWMKTSMSSRLRRPPSRFLTISSGMLGVQLMLCLLLVVAFCRSTAAGAAFIRVLSLGYALLCPQLLASRQALKLRLNHNCHISTSHKSQGCIRVTLARRWGAGAREDTRWGAGVHEDTRWGARAHEDTHWEVCAITLWCSERSANHQLMNSEFSSITNRWTVSLVQSPTDELWV